MDDKIMIRIGEDGVARLYDDAYDVTMTIHCENEEEQKKVIELMGIASKLVRCGECANTHRPDEYTIWCTGRGFPEQLVARDGFCDKGRKNNV